MMTTQDLLPATETIWKLEPAAGLAERSGEEALEELTLRLAIVDSHQLFRECLAGVLARECRFEIAGKFATPQEALDRLAQIRPDVLEEEDGPVLQHGLKELHGVRLWVPSSTTLRPNREALEWRFQQFMKAAGDCN